MLRIVVMVGTRKGCFLLESDEARQDWEIRGPFCEGWPIYHAVHDPASGTVFAAAASEWHGAAIWRSGDFGATWQHSSEGLTYGDGGELKLSKVSGLAAAHGRLLAGGEAAGVFESRDGGETFSLLSTLDGLPGREDWNVPSNQPPGHLGMPGLLTHPDDPDRFYVVVQGFGIFETTDDGATWTPRNEGLRAEWPRPHPDVGFCVHKLVMAPDRERLYQQNHCGMHRSDDAGHSWTEITEGLPADFGFVLLTHPRRDGTAWVIPLKADGERIPPDGKLAVHRTDDAGNTWTGLSAGLPEQEYNSVLRDAASVDTAEPAGVYFGTRGGTVYASADEGETFTEVASHLPDVLCVRAAVVAGA